MMVDFLSEFITSLTWRGALIGVLVFVVTFLVSLAIVSLILVKIPANHFKSNHRTRFWSGPNPALHAAKVVGKNILGFLLVVLGIVLSIPGVPGQGLLTILLGVMLLDFPGKFTLERKLLSRPEIVKTINRLRARFHKPPLELD
jgi:hypothetical protein